MSVLVKEWALQQLHWIVRKDPWVRDIFLAAGVQLDAVAERVVDLYYAEDFERMGESRVSYYEGILGLRPAAGASLDDRRAAVQAAWHVAGKPSVESAQAICDSWAQGGAKVRYEPQTLTVEFIGGVGVPENIEALQAALDKHLPPQIQIVYQFSYMMIKDIHDVLTIRQMEQTALSNFGGF